MKTLFSESELALLRERVVESESGTPGEVVIFLAQKSDTYEVVLWRGAAFGLLLSAAVWAIVPFILPGWGLVWLSSPPFIVLLFGIGSLVGVVLAKWNSLAFRLLAGKSLLARTVQRKAQRTFVEEGVMETAGRTGILLMVSILEQRIEVVADRGIAAVVPQARWEDVVDQVRRGLRSGDLVTALSDGISTCGDILRDSGIATSARDRNELSDDIRIETD